MAPLPFSSSRTRPCASNDAFARTKVTGAIFLLFIFWGFTRDTELRVRFKAAMSSVEGAEETTKDPSDLSSFSRTGEFQKHKWER